MLSLETIINEASSHKVFNRGVGLCESNEVQSIKTSKSDSGELLITAKVGGNIRDSYDVKIYLYPEDDTISGYDCDCQAFSSYYGMCKHCVAVAMSYFRNQEVRKVKNGQSGKRAIKTSSEISDLIKQCSVAEANVEKNILRGSVHLTPEYSIETTDPQISVLSSIHLGIEVELRISSAGGHPYVVKNIKELVENVMERRYVEYGKSLAFTHSMEMFDPESQTLLTCLQSSLQDRIINNPYRSYSSNNCRRLLLSSDAADRILCGYIGKQIAIVNPFKLQIKVCDGDPELPLQIVGVENGALLRAPGVFTMLSSMHTWLYWRECLYRLTPDYITNALPVLETLRASIVYNLNSSGDNTVEVFLSEHDYASFYASVLPRLLKYFDTNVSAVDFSQYRLPEPEFLFRLTTDDRLNIYMEPLVSYSGLSYPLFQKGNEYRSATDEQPVRNLICEYFRHPPTDGRFCLKTDDDIFNFLETGVDRLRETGDVWVDDKLKNVCIAPAPKVSVGISLHGNLIDLDVQIAELPSEEIAALMDSYRLKKRYHRLKSGEYLSLDGSGLSVIRELSDGLLSADFKKEIPAFRAQYINEVVSGHADIDLKRSVDFRRIIRNLRSFADGDYVVPDSLNARLRNYQQDGFQWMCALADYRLSGILADEMGLGKTIQSIAFLLHTEKSALIVCPASLMYNWENEIRKFAPSLCVKTVQGSVSRRQEILADKQDTDVFVTSYDLLKRDSKLYEQLSFGTVIIDEAQYIRNAGTQAAKAVKQLNADHRFALTGTPMENRLSDLWSIFDFLMPGFLYKYSEFKSTLEHPILMGDEAAQLRLKRMIAPFILRRKKSDVLQELPEKVESIRYVEMTETQRKLYNAQEQLLRQSLINSEESDFAANRLEYLSALTRLRQLCCDPSMFLENYDGGSGKTDSCVDYISELVESEHQVLVFSQFTTMLDILRRETDRRGMRSLCLTGSVNKEKRRTMVEAFQNGEIPIFFISLKAGGVGLNLTAADRVIHVDPWWNAAAEDQASDRAHRIGQKNTVFITKMVAQNTVEERILELQQAKRDLSSRILSGGDVNFGSIDREELLELLTSR